MYIKKNDPRATLFTSRIEEMERLDYAYDDIGHPRFQKSLHYGEEVYRVTLFLEELDLFWDLDGKGISSSEDDSGSRESRLLFTTVNVWTLHGDSWNYISQDRDIVALVLKLETTYLPIPQTDLLALETLYFKELLVKRDLSSVSVRRFYKIE